MVLFCKRLLLLFIGLILLISYNIDICKGQAQAERDAANEEAAKQSVQFIRTMPRPGGQAGLSTSSIDEMQKDPLNNLWLRGIVALAIMPLVIPALATFLCPFWFCCRCCACCCCRKTKPSKQLSFWNIWGCYFFLLAISIVSVVFAGIGYEANTEFSKALIKDGDTSLYGELIGILDDASQMLGNVVTELRDIPDSVARFANQTVDILGGVDVMKNETDELIWRLNNTAKTWNNYSFVVADNVTNVTQRFVCSFCKNISSQVGSVRDEVASSTGPIFDDLSGIVDPIKDTLVSQVDTITSSIDDFIDMIEDNGNFITDYKTQAEDDYKPLITQFNDIRELAYNILFAIPILPIVFVLLGGIFKLSICFTITYILLWLSFTIMFILLAIHLPIGGIFADMCGLLDEVGTDMTGVIPGDTGTILTICISTDSNETLLDAFGVSDDFNFADAISFDALNDGSLSNLSNSFDFGALNDFNNQTMTADFTEFYGAGDAATEALSAAAEARRAVEKAYKNAGYIAGTNANISNFGNWSKPNILDQLPLDTVITREQIYGLAADNTTSPFVLKDVWFPYPVNVTNYTYAPNETEYILQRNGFGKLIAVVVLERRTIDRFNSTIFKIQSNLTNIVSQVGNVELSVQVLVDNLTKIEQLFNPIFDDVDEVFGAISCSFIGDSYRNTKAIMCGQGFLGSLARIIISMMVIGFTSIIGCCASVRLVRKMHWRKVQMKEAKQGKKQGQNDLSMQQQQPTVIVMQQPMPNMQNMQGYAQGQPYGR